MTEFMFVILKTIGSMKFLTNQNNLMIYMVELDQRVKKNQAIGAFTPEERRKYLIFGLWHAHHRNRE